MSFFSNNPFVRILGYVIAGLLLAEWVPLTERFQLPALLVVLIILLPLAVIRRRPRFFEGAKRSILLALLLTALSYVNASKKETTIPPSGGRDTINAVVLRKSVEKANSFMTTAKVISSSLPALNNQTMIIYFQKCEAAKNMRAGDHLFAVSTINEVNNGGNPYEFDYKKYLSRKGISHTAYVREGSFTAGAGVHISPAIQVERIREKLISCLRERIGEDHVFQVVSALTLGYRDELTQETRSWFTTTGAIHILAVSGLHVGLIYLALNLLLSFLGRHETAGKFRSAITILCLWGYAMLTGMAPPVQRAAIMFTFVQFGNIVNRKTSTYNSIAASAFLILMLHPATFWDIGFQLSYSAVISIVFFYRRMVAVFRPSHPVTRWAWQLFCVSLSAQIGVLPLSVYYFHQFPVYFWLSNFVVIPAAYMIMGLTFIVFITYPIEMVSRLFASVLYHGTDWTTLTLKGIGQLPSPLIEGFGVSAPQLLCLLTATGTMMFFIKHRKNVLLFITVFLLLVCQSAGMVDKFRLLNQRKMIVYNSGERVIHLINGRDNFLITASGNTPDRYVYGNVVRRLKLKPPVVLQEGNIPADSQGLENRRGFMQFADKTVILRENELPQSLAADTIHLRRGLLDLTKTPHPVIVLTGR